MNQFNDNGEQHGYWEEKDDNCVINLTKGYFNNGIMEGLWELYTEWGLLFRGTYKNGDYNGFCVWYDKEGESEKEFYL